MFLTDKFEKRNIESIPTIEETARYVSHILPFLQSFISFINGLSDRI